MTNLEAKAILEGNAVPTFPLQISWSDWVDAMSMAAEALEKQEKYKWHDLRKNPNDLPEEGATVCFAIEIFKTEMYGIAEYKDFGFHDGINPPEVIHRNLIAWKYIEPFESKED